MNRSNPPHSQWSSSEWECFQQNEPSSDQRKRKRSNRQHNDSNSEELRSDPTQQVRKWAKKGLRIARTSVGKGVFATKRIPYATCIGEIEGDIHDYTHWESRYSFDLEDGRQLEPRPPFRYVNHSCQPNCTFRVHNFRDSTSAASGPTNPRILLYAIHDIWVGEELTIAYNWPLSFAIRCRCKAPSCRGWIVDPAYLDELRIQQTTC